MKALNTTSYVHVQIRVLCHKLSKMTGMALITDFNNSVTKIEFKNELGYITIDFRKKVCFVLGHRITSAEYDIIDTIMAYCSWLETSYLIKNKRGRKK